MKKSPRYTSHSRSGTRRCRKVVVPITHRDQCLLPFVSIDQKIGDLFTTSKANDLVMPDLEAQLIKMKILIISVRERSPKTEVIVSESDSYGSDTGAMIIHRCNTHEMKFCSCKLSDVVQ